MTTGEATLDARALNLELYRSMLAIRRFEEAAYRAYESGEVVGTIHASIGQEAVAVGVISSMRPQDLVFSHHRGHGHALAKGVKPEQMFGELLARAYGASGGKGGSMHITDVSVRFMGSYAVVGGPIPLAVGVALAAQRRREDSVTVVFFGDGAINQGVLYESLNLASIWRLPIVFVCENNGFAISVPTSYATGGAGVTARASAFGLRAEQVDGQSVSAVRAAAAELIEGARSEGRPALLEALTYRFVGHSRGDPAHGLYRTKEELDQWRERDPLIVHREEAGLDSDTCDAIDSETTQSIDDAFDIARAYPRVPQDMLMRDVWGDA